MSTRRAISSIAMPSGWACNSVTTRIIRASRSRLPDLGSSSTTLLGSSSGRRRNDPKLAAARRGRQAHADRALQRALAQARSVAVDAAGHPADLAVEERPVVELAAPPLEPGVTDEPGHLWERGPERGTVDRRDPAVRGAGALDDVDAVELGRG